MLRIGCRSIAVSTDAGSFGIPELGVRAVGGHILYVSLGLIWTLGLFAPGAETIALKQLVVGRFWVPFAERSTKGYPRELFGVGDPSESSLVSIDPLKGVSPYIGLFRV